MKATTRQGRHWQERRQRGLCGTCGNKVALYSRCAPCRTRGNKLRRKRIGLKPWKPGKRGRPPIEAALVEKRP